MDGTAEIELRAASDFTVIERVELFNAGYEGYVVPMHIDETGLTWMQGKLDFDLDASRIAYCDGAAVGFANLAIRGDEAWVGGVGVVTSARRTGVGEALMEAIHEQARERGIRRVWLEVIAENTGAFALYEKLGYAVTQDVEVWMLDGAPDEHAEHDAREVPASEIELPAQHEPWQRADGTLAHYDDVRGLVTDSGSMLFCVRSKVQPQRYTGEPEPLIRALRTYGDLYWLNLPTDDPAAAVLRELGGTVVVRQHEMVLEL